MDTWNNTDPPDTRMILYPFPIKLGWASVAHVDQGLLNLGNSCFLNASVQALLHVPAMLTFMERENLHRAACQSDKCTLCAMYKCYRSMMRKSLLSHKTVADLLSDICRTIIPGQQADAAEFLRGLLISIGEQEERRFTIKLSFCAKLTTSVCKIFGMWQKTTDVCDTCLVETHKYEHFMNLFLPTSNSIQGAIDEVLGSKEVITEYTCNKKCPHSMKGKGSCHRTVTFHTNPNIMMFVIDRFGDKMNDVKDVSPMTLDTVVSVGGRLYKFLSGVVHHGTKVNNGHYTCIAACPDGLTVFDDHKVEKNPNALVESTAMCGMYIMFYELLFTVPEKRPVPPTPSKRSPLTKTAKKSPFERRMDSKRISHLSPHKIKVKKMGRLSFGNLSKCSDEESLATPLEQPGTASIIESESTVTAVVTPIKVNFRRKRSLLKPSLFSSPSESSSKSISSSTTMTAKVTPIKLVRSKTSILKPELLSSRLESASKSSSATETAAVTPLKLIIPNAPKPDQRKVTPLRIKLPFAPAPTMNCTIPVPVESDELSEMEQVFDQAENISVVLRDNIAAFSPSSGVGKNIMSLPVQCNTTAAPEVVLTVDDVPGAKLPLPVFADNTVRDLRRWMKCRKIPNRGGKRVLLDRIASWLENPNNNSNVIDQEIDRGEWLRKKMDRARLLRNTQTSPMSFPEDGFEIFPSRDIPQGFNFGSVFHYLIETAPTMAPDEDSGTSSDEEVEETVLVRDPFQDPKCQEYLRAKVMRRGMTYVKSGWVRGMQDCDNDKFHYIKAHVRASMELEAYWVYITISKLTGGICQCTCGYPCPVTANGRCAHVSAALMQILAHVELNGYGSITCTSRPCEWNKGSLKRNPSAVIDRQYDSFKIDIKRRAKFDPRPTAFKSGPSKGAVNNFLCALSYKDVPCYWQLHLKLKYDDFEFTEESLQLLLFQRSEFLKAWTNLQNLITGDDSYEGPFEVYDTQAQSTSEIWHQIRSLCVTASCAKKICKMKDPNAIKRFLRQHLWRLDNCTTKAMRYGQKNEGIARKMYWKQKLLADKTVSVKKTGLHLHTQHVGFGCSLDGLVISDKSQTKTLEIKCPYMLRNHNPNNFEEVLQPKQLSRFCLTNDVMGNIILKDTHEYNYQVQMGMGMLGVQECDFFVWSKHGSVCVTVPFNADIWQEILDKMKQFHHEVHIPEYFAMRTPRDLPAITLPTSLTLPPLLSLLDS